MHVVATAGHVDHGKSTLVRALTGMEPDRWAEERRRGMTIDLGYAWTSLPSGERVAFVDVPGHARFLGNMLAGLGPAPAVLFVVAADEGWRAQSAEHLAAVDALGLTAGLLAVTRSDLADPGPATAEALQQLKNSSLGGVAAVAVSGATGAGLEELRDALADLVATLPPPTTEGRVRLWVDRAFTVKGSGTVVTGTLGAGRLRVGDTLQLGGRLVRVRELQSLGASYDEVAAVARVAVNLRGVDRDDVGRGDTLLTPQSWWPTTVVDVRASGDSESPLPAQAVLHIGTASMPVHVRPLGQGMARLTLARPLPLQPSDRGVLRDPGRPGAIVGVVLLDTDPPALHRRGAAAERAAELTRAPGLSSVLAHRGAVRRSDLAVRGLHILAEEEVRFEGDWLIHPPQWNVWVSALSEAVDRHAREQPLDPALPTDQARRLIELPDLKLLAPLAAEAGLQQAGGRLRRPGSAPAIAPNVQVLVDRLAAEPFAAPEQPDLDELGIGRREIGAAVAAGSLLRLSTDVLLLPDAPARAMRVVAALPQPFSVSAARQALGTTRRVAIPLLEHLDARGWTRRLDGGLREIVR
ncbi:MAG: selenocysteine-specific translation elongation factor [Actinobacteria bacterium]|nr:selenocysteine-specific translation elongation factor [Actinomycetota bacterium]